MAMLLNVQIKYGKGDALLCNASPVYLMIPENDSSRTLGPTQMMLTSAKRGLVLSTCTTHKDFRGLECNTANKEGILFQT